jgi:hypothetical protein
MRSRDNPLGNPWAATVRSANIVTSRVALLILMCLAKGIHWIVEQPMSSVMIYIPEFQLIKNTFGIVEVATWMGCFGADSPKATILYSSSQWLTALARKRDKSVTFNHGLDIARHYTDAAGNSKVQGGADLKATQAYPPAFGEAVARAYKEHAYDQPPPLCDLGAWRDLSDAHPWMQSAGLVNALGAL